VRSNEPLSDTAGDAELAQREPVDERIVGHQPLDPSDATRGEVVQCPGQETGAGLRAFVRVDLGVGQAAVVVDERVDEVITGPVSAVEGRVRWSV